MTESRYSFLIPRIPKQNPNPEERQELNPIKVFQMMTGMNWLLFFSGWLSWSMDAWDFFSVSLTVKMLAAQFGKSTNDITTSITLTLLFRSLGAVLFGLLADRYGRKWTLVTNLLIIAVLQLGSGFVNTFSQFLAVRSLFGIAMGGVWGASVATALENIPVRARGLLSGILQQGYACGYLFAACVNLTAVQTNPHHWRILFWIGSGLSAFAAMVRAALPESNLFLAAREEARLHPEAQLSSKEKTKAFLRETGIMIKTNKLKIIHGVLLMTGFNFLSHGSQDLYPTYLQVSKSFTAKQASIATIIGNCGAIAGGTIAGYMSQYLGRRITMIAFILLIGAFIPLWIVPTGFSKLSAGAFCVQFGVQGAWGIIPIHLNELSPPAFRGTFPGVSYQLGNMVSSAAAQIEATAGDHLKTLVKGVEEPDYAKIQGILIGVVAIWTIIMVVIGGENHSSHFEEAKIAFEEGGGKGELRNAGLDEKARHSLDEESRAGDKASVRHEESAAA